MTGQESTLSPTATTRKFVENTNLYPLALQNIVIVLYVIVTCLGIIGNGAILYLFASRKIRYTSFNLLIFNLAIADFLADIFAYPYIFMGIDLGGLRQISITNANLACAFTIGLTPFWMVTGVSIITLSFVSYTRYLKIKHPLKDYCVTGSHGTKTFLLICWVIGICIPIPNFFSFKYLPESAVCGRSWPRGFDSIAYRISTAFISIFLPTLIMLFTLITTRYILSVQSRSTDNIISQLPDGYLAKRRKVVRLFGALIIVFLVFWSPFFTYWVLAAIIPQTFIKDNNGGKVICACILVALCNTVANPVIYALRGEAFQKGLKDTLQEILSSRVGKMLSTLLNCKKEEIVNEENLNQMEQLHESAV